MLSAASEAIRALEGVAREVASLPTGTLGDCIKELRARKQLTAGTAKCLDGVWTIANSTHGIRHGASQVIELEMPEAEFFLDSCASAIRLLLAVNAAHPATHRD
jgi:hypothetical protein